MTVLFVDKVKSNVICEYNPLPRTIFVLNLRKMNTFQTPTRLKSGSMVVSNSRLVYMF